MYIKIYSLKIIYYCYSIAPLQKMFVGIINLLCSSYAKSEIRGTFSKKIISKIP